MNIHRNVTRFVADFRKMMEVESKRWFEVVKAANISIH